MFDGNQGALVLALQKATTRTWRSARSLRGPYLQAPLLGGPILILVMAGHQIWQLGSMTCPSPRGRAHLPHWAPLEGGALPQLHPGVPAFNALQQMLRPRPTPI